MQAGRQRARVAALSRRVEHDQIGTRALFCQTHRNFARIAAEKLRIPDARAPCVLPRVFHGLRHDLRAQHFARGIGHRKPDRTGAAVKIEQQLCFLRISEPLCLRIKPLGLRRVDLIKALRGERQRNAAQRIADRFAAAEQARFRTEYDICALGVNVQHHRTDLRECHHQRRSERFEPLLDGLLAARGNKADHDLMAVIPPPQIQMPHNARAALLVVGGDDLVADERALTESPDLPEDLRQQTAFPHGNEPVRARRKQPEPQRPGLLVGAAGILRLIPIAVSLLCAENRQNLARGDMPDTREGVADKLLLERQLRGIADMPEHTAAASAEIGAVGLDPVGRGRVQPFDDPVGIAFLHLDDPHIEPVADGGLRHKYGKTAEVSDAVAFCGHTRYFQLNDLIFADGAALLLHVSRVWRRSPGRMRRGR